MTKEEFLKLMKTNEIELKEAKKEVVKFDDGDPDCLGWEIRFVDEKETIEVALGCKCSTSNTLHNEL